MKKILAVILAALFVMCITGCGGKEKTQAYFNAEVLEISENSLWVRVVNSGNTGIAVWEEFYVTKNVTSEKGCPELSAGDTVKVYFNGDVMESYPLQLGTVYAIEKLS